MTLTGVLVSDVQVELGWQTTTLYIWKGSLASMSEWNLGLAYRPLSHEKREYPGQVFSKIKTPPPQFGKNVLGCLPLSLRSLYSETL